MGPDFQPIPGSELRVEFERVSPYDVYPSPHASSPQDGDFIERVRLTRRSLYQAIGIPGYSEQNIRAVLDEYGRGGLHEWLWRDYERQVLEGRDSTMDRHDADTMDGLHYWGRRRASCCSNGESRQKWCRTCWPNTRSRPS